MSLIITIILIWLIILTVQLNGLGKRVNLLVKQKKPSPLTPKKVIEPTPVVEMPISTPEKSYDFSKFEKLLTENLFTKIGAISLIIASGLLVRYAFNNNLINDYVQITLGYALSAGLIFSAKKVTGEYIQQALFGTGLAGLYIVTFAGYSFYHILPLTFASLLMLITVGFTVATSLKYNSQVIALLGLAGAYLIPILMGKGGDITIFLAYVVILNAVGAFIYYKKSWLSVSLLNLIATFDIFWNLLIIKDFGDNIDFILYSVVWLIHFTAHFMQNSKKEDLIQFTNFALFAILSLAVDNIIAVAAIIIAGFIYLAPMALDVAKKQTFKLEVFYSSASFLLFISSAFIYFNNNYYLVYSIIALAVASFALALTFRKEYFMFIATVILGAAFTRFATEPQIFTIYNIADFTPLLNQRALTLLAMIFIAGVFTFIGFKQKLKYEGKLKSLSLFLLSLITVTFALTEINDISRMLMQQHKFSYSAIRNYQHLSEIFAIFAVTISLFRWGYQYTVTRFAANFGFSAGIIYLFAEGFDNAGMLIPALNFRVLVWLIVIGILAKAACKSKGTAKRYATYISLSLATVLLWSEIDLFTKDLTTELLTSVLSLIFAALILFAGAQKDIKDVRYFATGLISIIIAKVFFNDLSYLDEIGRIISSAFLGAILLAVSFYFSKLKKQK